MKEISDKELDRLLAEGFGRTEVSPDFTLRLWRRLMNQPYPWFRQAARVAVAGAVLIGLTAGFWTRPVPTPSGPAFFARSPLSEPDRLDLFGNAPLDSLSGSYLSLKGRG